ncbi:hypothetical protein [Stenotrophomonas oahuensis]|uniref:Na+-dependent transporter n=1 Tax=Stenotrophomonas oahuensis TaxID=3003271 RepID=A0ABY9YMH7_9GAMM|nr:hypothetical protein [Stenotrophomonas sp. A5586]WNH52106.1 hypothetical protein PDM29_17460 [Stenotrophomonas sp. A5586]
MSMLMAMKLVIVVSVVLSAMALAMRARATDMLYLVRHPGLALRAIVSMYVVVPLVVLAIIWLVQPPPGVQLALLVLSLSPVPPLLPKKQLKSGGEGAYIIALLVSAAVISLVLMPIALPMLGVVFGREFPVSTSGIAKTLAITVLAPMLLGLVAQKLLGAHAERASHLVSRIGFLLLLAGGMGALIILGPKLWELIGDGTLLALALVIVAGLVSGYLLGGPARSIRAALALASATRHPGVAMGVIGSSFPDAKLAIIAVLMFVLLNVILGIPFVKVSRRDP